MIYIYILGWLISLLLPVMMLCCGDDDVLVLLPIDILTLQGTTRSRDSVSQPCFAFLLDIQYKTATEQITMAAI